VTALTLPLTSRSRPAGGGTPARRAVIRWAWRLFRREWRQQLLILSLIVVAVAATIVGSAVAVDTRQAATFGFGTARDQVTYPGYNAHIGAEITALQRQVARTEVIENETVAIPGTIDSYQLRAESSHGPYSGPMLSLVSGHYPTGAGEVAVTAGVASAFHLGIGTVWHQQSTTRRVVGIVENPQSLLDEFALVVPGQVTAPSQVIVLFDAGGAVLKHLGAPVETPGSVGSANAINPETISLVALILGMLLIALVSIGGFTVLAQRRLRSIGMLESLGATDKHVSLVVRANGAVVGIVGAVIGFLLGLGIWLAYRPTLEQSSHHLIGVLALPWLVVALAMVLAVVATYFAASRPAKAVTRLPIVAALSGRPAPPRQIRRSVVPGIVFLVVAFVLLGVSGASNGNGGGATPALLFGLLALIPGVILLAPFLLTLVARIAGSMPIAGRLALRDLARYRARSGSALSAISIGVLVAVIVSLAAAARYGNVLDYAGPNLASNQMALHYLPPPPVGSVSISPTGRSVVAKAEPTASPALLARSARSIATGLGGHLLALEAPGVSINVVNTGPGQGRSWNGPIYVATPQLLRAFGISPSQINPDADILTARPGLSGVSGLSLSYGNGNAGGKGSPGPGGGNGPNSPSSSACDASTDCLAHPVIQELGALPAGTSAPNTVITEHAVRQFHLQSSVNDWLVIGTHPFSAAQISGAQTTAATTPLAVESKNDQPSSSQVIDYATAFGIFLALGILAMSVGLVRSETAGDLRTLSATGASGRTRRNLAAVTTGTLGFLGALLGTAGGYIALAGWLRSNSLNGGIGALGNIPIKNLGVLIIAMPLVAAVAAWLLAGREPPGVARQPMQ
jgi:putative ABC transport system permease protein